MLSALRGQDVAPAWHGQHMAGIHLTDIEAAINGWRDRSPLHGGAPGSPPDAGLALPLNAPGKGCGRRLDEVQARPRLSPAQKRATRRRITAEGSAWRFKHYAERARLGNHQNHQNPPDPADLGRCAAAAR